MRVHFQVIEGQRRRIQVFEGIVIKRQGAGSRETFTVRKQSFGVGVERTFPLHSPKIDKIEVQAIGDVSRAKLYYLRGKVGKKARVREKQQRPGEAKQRAAERALAATERRRRPTEAEAEPVTEPEEAADDAPADEPRAASAQGEVERDAVATPAPETADVEA